MSGDNAEWTASTSTGTKQHIYISTDSDLDTKTDVTKYIIAKDGVFITVESRDEDKAKDILETLEKKLDIKK